MTSLLTYLMFVARQNDIMVNISDELAPETPDICVPSQRKIIINERFATSVDVTFRLAHELAHILFGNSDANTVYTFSLGYQRDSERAAHRNALHMIAKFVYQDTPIEYRNYLTFMDTLGLPSWFEEMSKDAVLNA